MQRTFQHQLYACGERPLPAQITVGENSYRLSQVFKNDFFAATALYEYFNKSQEPLVPTPQQIILKLNRQEPFLGLPLAWLGEMLCSHQISILRHLNHLNATPRFISRYGPTGLVYQYIPGRTLEENTEKLPDDFFDQLLQLLRQIHQAGVVYLDTNKTDNIILGPDGRPHLVDFQISLHIGKRFLFSRRLAEFLRITLQNADLYHFYKHKRKLAPELLTPEEYPLSRPTSKAIRLHRLAATPLRKLRRKLLRHLQPKDPLTSQNNPSQPTK
ncbi:MAG: hypothetical protein JSV99_03025 [Planctomycetota bacterium]|nr:MAG: hypothetical protein JSV99_03025 [Planctomycetota bacterium]